jgi:hypothetical protein
MKTPRIDREIEAGRALMFGRDNEGGRWKKSWGISPAEAQKQAKEFCRKNGIKFRTIREGGRVAVVCLTDADADRHFEIKRLQYLKRTNQKDSMQEEMWRTF